MDEGIIMKLRIFLVFLAILMLSGIAAAELPNSINDGNHFYQEITVSGTSSTNNALIHLWVPYPNDFSGAWDSYRFYDSNGNLLKFHVFGGNDTHASVSIRMNVTTGNNTVWMTVGNTSLSNAGTTTVYGFYNDSNFSSSPGTVNTNWSTGSYNFAQIKINPTLTANTSVIQMNMGSQYLYYYYRNGSQNYMEYRPNGTNGAMRIGGNMNSSGNLTYSFLAIDGIDGKTTVSSQSSMPTSYSGSLSYYNQKSEFGFPFSGNSVNRTISQPNSPGTQYARTVFATGQYISTTVMFGNVTPIPENIDGFYLRTVHGTTGGIVRMSLISPENNRSELGGTMVADAFSPGYAQQQFPNLTVTTGNGTDVYLLFDKNFTSQLYLNSMTAVVYVPAVKNETVNVDFKPVSNSYYSRILDVANSNYYNLRIGQNTNVITVPISHNASLNRTGLYGQIVDSSGNPIDNVSVEYLNQSTGAFVARSSSTAGGMFGYSNLQVNTTLFLTFNKTGYVSNSSFGSTSVNQNNSIFVNVIVLEKLHNISVSVVDENGNPVQSFTTFLGSNQTIRSTDNGTVTYNNVTSGEHEIIIQAAGFQQVTRMINIEDGGTDFILRVSREPAQEFVTPHFVRLFYRTVTGAPVQNLSVSVYAGSDGGISLEGITGEDGSVAFRLEETIKYRFVASMDGINISDFSTFPKSSEYIIIIRSQTNQEPSKTLSNISYTVGTSQMSTFGIQSASTNVNINVGMKSSNDTDFVRYDITIYQENEVFATRSGSFSGTKTETFSVPTGHVYSSVITFTDEDGKKKTVSKTIRLDAADLKTKFNIPGFTEQWHYNALCVFIVLITSFSFSERTFRIGGLVIPAIYFLMVYLGWMQLSVFAVCSMMTVLIMTIIYFAERMDRE